jgi:pentatricopeptide repeat protein
MYVLPCAHAQIQRYIFISDKHPLSTTQSKHSRNIRTITKVAGELAMDRRVFDEIPVSDKHTFAWNNLIQTHLANEDFDLVMSTYRQMLLRGTARPDRRTLPRILTASWRSGDIFIGKQLHGHALKLGFSSDHYVVTALIEMYGRLDSVDTAKWVFEKSPHRNPVSWTLLARLYIKQNKPGLAINMFNQMVDSGDEIDSVALATAVGACSMLKSLQQGRKLHRIAMKYGLEFDALVSNTLLKMYIDCGSIKDARAIFDRMPSKDVITWTALINGYVKKGGFNEGLKLFRQMNMDGLVKPDSLTFSSVLPACARMAAHKHGKEIHGYLLRSGINLNIMVQNAVMDMYVKSGFIEYAFRIFTRMKDKDVVSWTVMIMGYSLHGQGEQGVHLFCTMDRKSSIHIDQITYAAVLHACSTARMVEQGKFYFNCIKAPKVTNYSLMVGLLARAGLFEEAKIFIEEQKVGRHAEVLKTLLDGCRNHQQLVLGKRVIEQLCDLEPLNADNYVLLSNWYANSERWAMVHKLRETIRDMGLNPKKAYSWIEFRNKVHVFGTGDVSHPRSERIYGELQCLVKKIEDEEGYRPNPDFSLHDVEEERECIQIGHSEMLAISFGLITTQPSATIHVTKNLRVCRNCHDSAKLISKTVGREIILKDLNCFHHFKDGFCSCGGFW